jgi:hypothetical protein
MSIKNLLVLKNYNIKTTKKNNLIRPGSKSAYNEMQELVIESALQFIPNLDDIIVDLKEVDTEQDMFKDHMIECFKHWADGKSNVLYCDLDVIFIKKCDVFSLDIKDFFMPADWTCSVRYYPCTMSQHLWEIMFKEHSMWNTDSCKWDHEQDIYKIVETAAKGKVYNKCKPDFKVRDSPINKISDLQNFLQTLSQDSVIPHALHLHSTKDPFKCVQYMSDIRKLTV